MKYLWVFIALVLITFAGDWVYRTFLRPIDPLQPEVLALANHFSANGLKVSPYPVKHGFRHSYLVASAAFKIEGFPLPVSVGLCPSQEIAADFLASAKASPNLMFPQQNGRLVIVFPMWGSDTEVMVNKVQSLFASFSYNPAPTLGTRHEATSVIIPG